jgi:hypothetical protein
VYNFLLPQNSCCQFKNKRNKRESKLKTNKHQHKREKK